LKTAKHFFKTQNFPLLSSFKIKKLPHTLQQKIPAFKNAKVLSPKISNKKKKRNLVLRTNFM
jgi:hypothetical protein